jgi:hypothetical protein
MSNTPFPKYDNIAKAFSTDRADQPLLANLQLSGRHSANNLMDLEEYFLCNRTGNYFGGTGNVGVGTGNLGYEI